MTPATTGRAVNAPPVKKSCIIAAPIMPANVTDMGFAPRLRIICTKGKIMAADAALDWVIVPARAEIMNRI